MPRPFLACRICMISENRLLLLSNSLLEFYKTLIDDKFGQNSSPIKVCHICHHYLRKCLILQSKSQLSNAVYDQLFCDNDELIVPNIDNISWNLAKSALKPEEYVDDDKRNVSVDVVCVVEIKREDNEDEVFSTTVCRICVSQTNRLIPILNTPIQAMYEKLSSSKLITEDQRPTIVCFICHHQLRKCMNLVSKSKKSNQVFMDMIKNNLKHPEAAHEDVIDGLAWSFSISPAYITDSAVEIEAGDEPANHQIAEKIKDIKIEITIERDTIKQEIEEEENEMDTDQPKSKEPTPIKPNVQKIVSEPPSKKSANKKKKHLCYTCDKSFSSLTHLNAHVRTHTGVKLYKCDLCNKYFSSGSYLRTHKRTHTGEKPYKCDFCNKSFTHRSYFTTHVRTHTGEKPFKCEFCDKSFSHRSCFTTHKRTHTGEKPYKCQMCEKCFSKQDYLNAHIRIHTGEKPYKCKSCDRCFTQESHLITHTVRTHTNEKSHKCDVCNKSFSDKILLKRHAKKHSAEKPFKCPLCEKCFLMQFSLKLHLRNHTGEKPYKCESCEKSFAIKSVLNRHMKTHVGDRTLRCDICDRNFCKEANHSKHMKLHSSKQSHKCDLCKKCFSDPNYLKRHMKTHMNDKAYLCNICDQQFALQSYLDNHLCIKVLKEEFIE